MKDTPKSLRLHIGLFGRRNVGKSSLLNALTKQETSIVSDIAGTTTDPVEKTMEFLPLGPVVFIDTAGVDDEGDLGKLRIAKTQQVFDRTDIAIVLTEKNVWSKYEDLIVTELKQRHVPIIIVQNKMDLCASLDSYTNINYDKLVNDETYLPKIKNVAVSAKYRQGLEELRQALIAITPHDFINNPIIIRDLVAQDECVVLVTPIDKEAPKGRLILPEVQTIRDALDGMAWCVVTQVEQLKLALERLKYPPKLVVTDSQCFAEVAKIVPENIPLTSFSILFARFKGDLIWQTEGVLAINKLQDNDKVLICESCSHHPIQDDIGRVKIPKILQKYVGKNLNIDMYAGHDFPSNLTEYKIVIHCGGCMTNRREMLERIAKCRAIGVPCTNYGLTIAHCLGILPHALSCFPSAYNLYKQLKSTNTTNI